MNKYNLYKQLSGYNISLLLNLTVTAGVLINGGKLKTKIVPKLLIN